MKDLTGSFDRIEWHEPSEGVKEKKIPVGNKIVRVLELTDRLSHPDWCVTGHTGYVLGGEFELNINGSKKILTKGDVFDVDGSEPGHRHIPMVAKGGFVRLLLVEKPPEQNRENCADKY